MPIRLTRAVRVLLVLCFSLFVIQQTGDQFIGTHIFNQLGLVPRAFWENHAYWQILTYCFLHQDVTHLFFNLMMLAFIGSELEFLWGEKSFLKYYFFCSVSAGVFYLILAFVISGGMNGHPLVGATGAIYGLLTAYGILFGERVLLFMMLFPMKAKHFVWVLGLIELMTTLYSPGGAVMSFGLLGGMVGGFLYLWGKTFFQLRKSRPLGKMSKKRKSHQHLRLIIDNEKDVDLKEDDSEKGNPKTWH